MAESDYNKAGCQEAGAKISYAESAPVASTFINRPEVQSNLQFTENISIYFFALDNFRSGDQNLSMANKKRI
jgi:hypothetical protein